MLPYSNDIQNRYELEVVCYVLSERNITFSKAIAAKLVGGKYRLEKLVKEGKIRAEKSNARQSGKWLCNGGDVLKFIKF